VDRRLQHDQLVAANAPVAVGQCRGPRPGEAERPGAFV
jgi:hypothetical protein